MAWRSHGTDNSSLVEALRRNGLVADARVEAALLRVDRGHFVREPAEAYEDAPQTIGSAATISAPHMHAHCLELLEPFLPCGGAALDVGSGSGYLTAVLSRLVGPGGRAVGVDHVGGLVEWSKGNLRKDPEMAQRLETGALAVHEADGRKGWAPGAPYDVIHVGAAAQAIPPALVEQLKPGGRLVIPVGPEAGAQEMVVATKDAASGELQSEVVMGVRYVPLTDYAHQMQLALRDRA